MKFVVVVTDDDVEYGYSLFNGVVHMVEADNAEAAGDQVLLLMNSDRDLTRADLGEPWVDVFRADHNGILVLEWSTYNHRLMGWRKQQREEELARWKIARKKENRRLGKTWNRGCDPTLHSW